MRGHRGMSLPSAPPLCLSLCTLCPLCVSAYLWLYLEPRVVDSYECGGGGGEGGQAVIRTPQQQDPHHIGVRLQHTLQAVRDATADTQRDRKRGRALVSPHTAQTFVSYMCMHTITDIHVYKGWRGGCRVREHSTLSSTGISINTSAYNRYRSAC